MKTLSVNAQEFIPTRAGSYLASTPPETSVSVGGTPVAYMLFNENNRQFQSLNTRPLAVAVATQSHQIQPHPAFMHPTQTTPPPMIPIQQPISTLTFSNINDFGYFYHQQPPQPQFQSQFR